ARRRRLRAELLEAQRQLSLRGDGAPAPRTAPRTLATTPATTWKALAGGCCESCSLAAALRALREEAGCAEPLRQVLWGNPRWREAAARAAEAGRATSGALESEARALREELLAAGAALAAGRGVLGVEVQEAEAAERELRAELRAARGGGAGAGAPGAAEEQTRAPSA
ncbi:unnamed protein product, partial [Prorocentrum cordatum]